MKPADLPEDVLEIWYRNLRESDRSEACFSLSEIGGVCGIVLADEETMAECRRRLLVRIADRDGAAVLFAESAKGQAFLAAPFLALPAH
jgi:hypothetical protein